MDLHGCRRAGNPQLQHLHFRQRRRVRPLANKYHCHASLVCRPPRPHIRLLQPGNRHGQQPGDSQIGRRSHYSGSRAHAPGRQRRWTNQLCGYRDCESRSRDSRRSTQLESGRRCQRGRRGGRSRLSRCLAEAGARHHVQSNLQKSKKGRPSATDRLPLTAKTRSPQNVYFNPN